jgi:hypothetical protein
MRNIEQCYEGRLTGRVEKLTQLSEFIGTKKL